MSVYVMQRIISVYGKGKTDKTPQKNKQKRPAQRGVKRKGSLLEHQGNPNQPDRKIETDFLKSRGVGKGIEKNIRSDENNDDVAQSGCRLFKLVVKRKQDTHTQRCPSTSFGGIFKKSSLEPEIDAFRTNGIRARG
jgi:hypothetical protein